MPAPSADCKRLAEASEDAWRPKPDAPDRQLWSRLTGDPHARVIPMGQVMGTAGEIELRLVVNELTRELISAHPFK